MRQSGNKHKRALSRLKVVLANTGDPNTFRREEMGTIIDTMFISDTLTIQGYVSEHYMHRNHQVIIFQMRTTIRSKQRKTPDMDVQKAATSYKFVRKCNGYGYADSATDADSLRRFYGFWWNTEINEYRKVC